MEEAKQVTVLIVDDEELIRDAIAFDFRRRGFKVLFAENGNQAFKFFQSEKVDLVISDFQMPECDGASFLRKMRETGSETPFIFISGGAHLTASECLRLGAQKFLAKPFDYQDLHHQALEILGL
jgi:two-component system OmpR family response regulator